MYNVFEVVAILVWFGIGMFNLFPKRQIDRCDYILMWFVAVGTMMVHFYG